MRPESDSPSTVVRSHDDRRASTSSESADGFVDVFARAAAGGAAGADVGVVDTGEGVVDAAEGVDGALASGAVRTAASEVAGTLSDRNHQMVPTRTAIPATPNRPTTTRARRPVGTGTASPGNGGDSNMREAVVDIEDACDVDDIEDACDVDDIEGVCDVDDIEGVCDVDDIEDVCDVDDIIGVCDGADRCCGDCVDEGSGAARNVSSENTLESSGGGGSFADSPSAWNGTVRASSTSASMSERASSSMPLTASSCAKIASANSGFSPSSVSRPRLSSPVESGRGLASPSAACTCAESTSSSRLASMTI